MASFFFFLINELIHVRGQASDVPSHEAGMPLVWLLCMARNVHNEQELRVVVINNGGRGLSLGWEGLDIVHV